MPLLVILIPRFGLIGAAMATMIPCFIVVTVLGYMYWRIFKPQLKPKEILLVLASFAILAAIVSFIPVSGKLLTVLVLIVAALIYIIVLTLMRLLTVEDANILFRALPRNKLTTGLFLWNRKVILRLNNLFYK